MISVLWWASAQHMPAHSSRPVQTPPSRLVNQAHEHMTLACRCSEETRPMIMIGSKSRFERVSEVGKPLALLSTRPLINLHSTQLMAPF